MTTTIRTLTYAEAIRLVEAAHQASADRGETLTAAVVDASGHLLASGRMDGAAPLTIEVAERKARMAQTMKKSLVDLMAEDLVRTYPEIPVSLMSSDQVKVMMFPGALPIFDEGVCVGAVGVSGGSGDTAVCEHAVNTVFKV